MTEITKDNVREMISNIYTGDISSYKDDILDLLWVLYDSIYEDTGSVLHYDAGVRSFGAKVYDGDEDKVFDLTLKKIKAGKGLDPLPPDPQGCPSPGLRYERRGWLTSGGK